MSGLVVKSYLFIFFIIIHTLSFQSTVPCEDCHDVQPINDNTQEVIVNVLDVATDTGALIATCKQAKEPAAIKAIIKKLILDIYLMGKAIKEKRKNKRQNKRCIYFENIDNEKILSEEELNDVNNIIDSIMSHINHEVGV